MSLNNVILHGRLTKDVEIKNINNGMTVASFTIAVNRDYKNKQTGDYDADFIPIIAFDKRAETISTYFSKGSQIIVKGRIQTRNYENKEGKKVYVTEVVADGFDFCEKREQQQPNQQEQALFNLANAQQDTSNIPF